MPIAATILAVALLFVAGCGPKGDVAQSAPAQPAPPAQQQQAFANSYGMLDQGLAIEDSTARKNAVATLFARAITGNLKGLDEELARWPRDDDRWNRALPGMLLVLPSLNDQVGKDPALVHLVTLVCGADAKRNPDDAAAWAGMHFTGAARDVAYAVIAEELALESPAQATLLTNEIRDEVLRLDAVHGIASSLGAVKPAEAFAWVATLPAESREDAEKAVYEGWARRNPRDAAAYALREKNRRAVGIIFEQWTATAPGDAALASKALADPAVRANATGAVLDVVEQITPVGMTAVDWTRGLPAGAGHDAVCELLAVDLADQNPGEAWKISAAIAEAKTRGDARRALVSAVAADEVALVRKLIDEDHSLPADEAASLRGLIAARSQAASGSR
ncbi:MAG: hypothetical protein ACREKL_16545 [Chthoniobacterales bacterium]